MCAELKSEEALECVRRAKVLPRRIENRRDVGVGLAGEPLHLPQRVIVETLGAVGTDRALDKFRRGGVRHG